MFAILILHTLILRSGDNIEILLNPNSQDSHSISLGYTLQSLDYTETINDRLTHSLVVIALDN